MQTLSNGQRRKRELAGDILNVSILGNFAFGRDEASVVVTARRHASPHRRWHARSRNDAGKRALPTPTDTARRRSQPGAGQRSQPR